MGLKYLIFKKDGSTVHGSAICFLFLWEKKGKINGVGLEDIDFIEIYGEVKNFSEYDRILSSSIFREDWKSSIYSREGKVYFKIPIHEWNLTRIMITGSLFRVLLESPKTIEDILYWKNEGYSPDISIYLGHMVTSDRGLNIFLNRAHVFFAYDICVKGLLTDLGALIRYSKNKERTFSQQTTEKDLYMPITFLRKRHKGSNRAIRDYFQEKRGSLFPFPTKILEESLKKVINEIKT